MPSLRHHAVLIGIDRYLNLEPHAQLHSCVNDARLMAKVLEERYGFRPEELNLLLDDAATQTGIRAALEALRAAVRAGDAVVFYYSGHGSKTAAHERYKASAVDETIFPYDSGRKPLPNRDITDEEIAAWLLAVSTVTTNLVVIADTCYGGGVTRDDALVKWVAADDRPAGDPPPALRGSRPPASGARDTAAGGLIPPDDRYVLLAACRAGEHAKELTEKAQSVFTYYLCQELQRAPAGATYRDVMERVQLAVAAEVTDQMPQLAGARDRLLFGEATSRPAPFLPVAARQDRWVRLGGGAVHGVDAGALWAIHPPGTAHPLAGRCRGLVRITAVQAATADAEILEDQGPIVPGDRAFERTKGPGWMRLTLEIDEFDAARPDERAARELAAALLRSPLLRLAQPGEPAELRLAAAEPTAALLLDAPSWVALHREGDLALPPVAREQPGAAGRLVQALETLARARNLLAVEPPPGEDAAQQHRVEVDLLRRRGDGAFETALPDAGGEVVFEEGEGIALRVTHHAGMPLHIHVLDVGLASAVSLIYPFPGMNEALDSARTLEIGTRPGEEMVVQIPPELVERCRAARQPEVAGREAIRVFATAEEADLSGWQQASASRGNGGPDGVAARGAAPGLAARLTRALGGGATRGDPPPAAAGAPWSVRTVGFRVRRPLS
jgi:hypothetical protein